MRIRAAARKPIGRAAVRVFGGAPGLVREWLERDRDEMARVIIGA